MTTKAVFRNLVVNKGKLRDLISWAFTHYGTARTAVMKAARGCAALFKKWSTDWEAIGGSAATMPSSSVRGALQNRSARSKAAF